MRKYRAATVLIILSIFTAPALLPAQTGGRGHGASSQAGEHQRAIKSLSARDIADLEAGRGWGLDKAAELNGMPGPVHLLELKSEIVLSEALIKKFERLLTGMKRKGWAWGRN